MHAVIQFRLYRRDFRNLIEQVCTQDILVKDVIFNFIREKYDLWDKQAMP